MSRTSAALITLLLLNACTPGSSHKDSAEYKTASDYMKAGNLQAGAEAWRKMVLADPDDSDSAIELSAAERKLGNASEAVKLMSD